MRDNSHQEKFLTCVFLFSFTQKEFVMQRRHFFLNTAVFGLSAAVLAKGTDSYAQSTVTCSAPVLDSGINTVEAIKALRINTGPYAGAYEIAPNGLSNWYFTNLGLISIVQYLSPADLDKYIRTYLDLYISKMETNMSIQDIQFPFGRANTSAFTLVPSDSDDSYAATTLSLAVRYLRSSQNWIWWDKNKSRLKDMAYRNIATAVKSNGLTSVFQAPRSQVNNAGYLMDNCEAYRGLRDFSALLKERGDTADAAYYGLFATNIANALTGLFIASSNAFKMADLSTQTETSFYPGTSCQIFPQVFDVSELSGFYDRAWNFLNTYSKGWESGSLDPYPWAILGLAAAKRGQTALAQSQQRSIEKTFAVNRPLVTINELGFYQRTKSILAGRSDV
jgi:hypothetical protein